MYYLQITVRERTENLEHSKQVCTPPVLGFLLTSVSLVRWFFSFLCSTCYSDIPLCVATWVGHTATCHTGEYATL